MVDRIDHLQGCISCCARNIVKRHNAFNYTIRRNLRQYEMSYSVEPKGYPLSDARNQGGANGPDGLLETTEGVETCIDIHCTHPKLHVSHLPGADNKPATQASMCVVKQARYSKKCKYETAEWDKKYPGTPLQLFTISSFGVLDSETLQAITSTWLPMLKDRGAGFVRTLQVDLWFTAAKFLGTVLRIAQIGQS